MAIAVAQLCFLPWALGGIVFWAQLVSLGLGVAALAVAAQRRVYQEPYTREGNFLLLTLPRLWRFPVFWIGLAFFGYITLQGLNPSHVRMSDDKGWWMEPVSHLTWLPSGMQTSLESVNAWRMLIIYVSVWLLVCALWIGVTRRAAVTHILAAVVANGTLLALVGILQKVTHAKQILWFVPPRASYFMATIPYKNHAGAFFYLVLALCAALVLWHALRGSRRLARTSPAPVYGFCAVILALAVVLSFSKGAILLMIAFLVACLLGFVGWLFFDQGSAGNRTTALSVAGLLVLFITLGGVFLRIDQPLFKVQTLLEKGEEDSSVGGRRIAAQATWEMAKDKIWTGWGAGGFRHYFPVYQRNHPEIYVNYRGKIWFWTNAHNDYLQGLAELGIIGMLFPVSILLWWLWQMLRLNALRRPVLLLGLAGLFMIMLHSWIDFQMFNPAILTTWCAAWPLLTRWGETERG